MAAGTSGNSQDRRLPATTGCGQSAPRVRDVTHLTAN